MNIHEGIRWVFDPADCRAHALADPPAAPPGMLVTVCGREFPADRTTTYGVAPSVRLLVLGWWGNAAWPQRGPRARRAVAFRRTGPGRQRVIPEAAELVKAGLWCL